MIPFCKNCRHCQWERLDDYGNGENVCHHKQSRKEPDIVDGSVELHICREMRTKGSCTVRGELFEPRVTKHERWLLLGVVAILFVVWISMKIRGG
jgi:hypothetical protein